MVASQRGGTLLGTVGGQFESQIGSKCEQSLIETLWACRTTPMDWIVQQGLSKDVGDTAGPFPVHCALANGDLSDLSPG